MSPEETRKLQERSVQTAGTWGQGNIRGLDEAMTRRLVASTVMTESFGGNLTITNAQGYVGRYQAGAGWLADADYVDAQKLHAAMKRDGFTSEWKWANVIHPTTIRDDLMSGYDAYGISDASVATRWIITAALAAILGACRAGSESAADHSALANASRAMAPKSPAHVGSVEGKTPMGAPSHSSLELKAGERIIRAVEGDVDNDGTSDLLTVAEDASETAPRALLIATRRRGGVDHVLRADKAILCKSCGGLAGDPLSKISVTKDGFELLFEGGSREQWSRRFQFVWDDAKHTWVLQRYLTQVVDTATGTLSEKQRTTASVNIERFDASAYID